MYVIAASHGRTVIRPSATSGRYCWLRVTPAAKSDGSGAGAPYCLRASTGLDNDLFQLPVDLRCGQVLVARWLHIA